MRKTTFLSIAMLMACFSAFAGPILGKVFIVGANNIPNNTGYETLKEAFDAINAQSDQTGKDIEIQIAANTIETATAELKQPTTASWNSLTIYPTAENVSISGNFLNVLIDLNGADKVTINGKLNQNGVSKSLIINQEGYTDNAARTIRLWNDATNNTITHCIIKGSCPSSGAGIIFISTAIATGNDDNTISYNDISKSGTASPQNAIYAAGTSAKMNERILIDNNNFFNLFSGDTFYAIKIGAHNSESTITNNNIYEPSEIVPTDDNNYYGISITASTGDKFNISNNFIGGNAPGCVGTFKKSNAFSNAFQGIFVSVSASSSNGANINGNVIKNFEWKNADVKKDFNVIQTFGNAVSVGSSTGNTISNILWENGVISDGVFYGINIQNTGGLNVAENNTISNITINNTNPTHGSNFYGLFKSNSVGSVTFQNNTISGINATGSSTANSQIVAGIHCNYATSTIRTFNFDIIGNTIYNINNASSRSDVGNSAYGIFVNPPQGSGAISKNKVYSITASDATLPARVVGINMDVTSTSTATICSNNMITLGNSNSGLVYGILQNTGLGKVINNSVFLTGSPATGSFESSALNVTGATAGREFMNNILYNTRSNTGTADGKHYGLKMNATTDLTSDFNAVNSTGTGGNFGAIATTDYSTAAQWIQNSNNDKHSVSSTVNFTAPATADLSLTGASIENIDLAALRLPTVSADFSSTARETITYKGAHEASNLTTIAKYFNVNVPNGTEKVYIAGSFTGKIWNKDEPFQLFATGTANQFSGILPCVNGVEYKYMCEKGDWDYEEGIYNVVNGESPTKLSINRTYNATDNVVLWYRVNKITLNVSFATNVPNTLFLKGSFDNWTNPEQLAKNGSTFSFIKGGTLGEKIPADVQYKYYTNDDVANNWESDASGNAIANRWTIAPVMNDVIARFTTAITTGLDKALMQAGVQISKNGIFIPTNGTSSIELYTLNGTLIDKTITNNSYSRTLSNGAYIVKINGKATKFVK